MRTATQITMYLHESDKWQEILHFLRREGVAGAAAFHAVGGFTGRSPVHTAHLVDAGGNLPLMLIFVDYPEHIERVLPKLRELAPKRLIVRENVTVEQGELD